MGMCTRIKADNVLYDERLFVRDQETGVPLPGAILPLPGGSFINGDKSTITVSVLGCNLVTDSATGNILGVSLQLQFNKTIVISRMQGGTTVDVATFNYSPIRNFTVPFTKINEGDNHISIRDFPRAHCQIFDIFVTDTATLTSNRTAFNDDAMVNMEAKVAQEEQLLVMLCPENMHATANITVGS